MTAEMKPAGCRGDTLERPSCRFHQHVLVDTPDAGRAGWIRTDCSRCGRFIGYRAKFEVRGYGGSSKADLVFDEQRDDDD